jgi:hypothetical protein
VRQEEDVTQFLWENFTGDGDVNIRNRIKQPRLKIRKCTASRSSSTTTKHITGHILHAESDETENSLDYGQTIKKHRYERDDKDLIFSIP